METTSVIAVVMAGIGTVLLALNAVPKSTYVRIVLIFLGAGLIAWSSWPLISNQQKSFHKINNTFSEFRSELQEAKADSSTDKANKLKGLSNKFEILVEEFKKNKGQKEIDQARKELSYKESVVKENAKVRPSIEFIINSLKYAFIAYNKSEDPDIRFRFDTLPQNIFSSELNNYISYFVSAKYFWRLDFYYSEIIEDPPAVVLGVVPLENYLEATPSVGGVH